jgi:hypothetical protein
MSDYLPSPRYKVSFELEVVGPFRPKMLESENCFQGFPWNVYGGSLTVNMMVLIVSSNPAVRTASW